MNQIIDKILTEWAYRVPDGMPDPKNPLHIIYLEESLNELKLPRKVIKKVLEKVRKYVDNTQNRKLDRVGKPWGSKGTPLKVKTLGKEYLTDLDIEVPKGLSDEEIESIAKTEKTKRDFITETIDLMISQMTQQRKGAGTNTLTQEEWQQLKDLMEGNGPDTPKYDINEDDIDSAIEQIRSKMGGAKMLGVIGKKGAAGKGMEDTTRKWLPNPDFDSSKPESEENPKKIPGPGLGRERRVIKSFLMTGGRSIVTGKPLSIGEAELDHRLSLDNGGKDEPENWVWMESKFNQQKSKLSDKKLIERAEKWLKMDPEKLKAKKKKDLITNESNNYAIEHWKEVFEKGGNGGITQELLEGMTTDQIVTVVKGWNKLHPKGDPLYIIYNRKQGTGNRARGVRMPKDMMIQSAISQINKKEKVLTSEEIAVADKVLYSAIEEIKTRKRDIEA